MIGNRKQIIEYLLNQEDGVLFEIQPKKEKRSLDANGLYWAVVGMIAKAVGNASSARIHNELLRRNPVFEMVEDKRVTLLIADTDETAERIYNETEYHLMPTNQCKMGTDGQMYRYWWMLKGSRNMTKEEFSTLLEEAISEAKSLGLRMPTHE